MGFIKNKKYPKPGDENYEVWVQNNNKQEEEYNENLGNYLLEQKEKKWEKEQIILHSSLLKKYAYTENFEFLKRVTTENLRSQDVSKEMINKYYLEILVGITSTYTDLTRNNSIDSYLEEELQRLLNPQKLWDKVMHKCDKEIRKKRIKEVASINIEDEQKKIISSDSVYNLEELWLDAFDKESFNNKSFGKALFYNILSILAKKAVENKELKGITYKKLTVHSITSQDTGTGKSMGLRFLEDNCSRINKLHNGRLIKVFYLSESSTYESFFNRPEINQKTKKLEVDEEGIPVVIEGNLAFYDLFLSNEASFMLGNETGENSSRQMNLWLQAAESDPIDKNLVGWGKDENGDPFTTQTVCNGVFALVSRPIDSKKASAVVLNSGLRQRLLNVTREVTESEKDEMFEKDIDGSYKSTTRMGKEEEEKNKLAQELYNFYTFIKNTGITFSEEDRVSIKTYAIESKNKIKAITEERIIDAVQIKSIEGFNRRRLNLIRPLEFLNAAVRKSKKIELCDSIKANDYVNTLLIEMIDWVGDNVAIDDNKYRKNMDMEKILKDILKRSPLIMEIETLKQEMMRVTSKSKSTVEKLLKQLNYRNKFYEESGRSGMKKMITVNSQLFGK